MDTEKVIVVESSKPQNTKFVKCPVCGISVEYNLLETVQSFKIKCYNCQNQFLPNQEESKSKSGENKIDTSLIFIKFRNPGIDEKPCNDSFDIIIDPKEFVEQFGGDLFSEYIGNTIFDIIDEFKEYQVNEDFFHFDDIEDIEKKSKRINKIIENTSMELAKKLLKKIESHIEFVRPYLNNTKELKKKEKESISKFKEIIGIEAEQLKNKGHGIELLYNIGYIYKLKSKQALGQYDINNGFILKKIIGYKNKFTSRILNSEYTNVKKMFNSIYELNTSFGKVRIQKTMNAINENIEEEKKKQLMDKLRQEAVINWTNTFWMFFKIRIRCTLIEVCNKVFDDTTVDPIEIKERAMAILAIAEVFTENIDNTELIQSTEMDIFNSDVGDWLIA